MFDSRIKPLLTLLMLLCPTFAHSQALPIDQSQLGAWYMYMWNADFKDSRWGLQGDTQHRNWDLGGDLEQLLIRGGVTYRPRESRIKYTLGYAHVSTGDFGPSSNTFIENRAYQEALIPQVLGRKLYLSHRFRLEQRWVENQQARNRIRYFLSMNYPLNQDTLGQGSVYLSLYNELFVNLEDGDVGRNRPQHVKYFDRNRAYAAMGYSVTDNVRLQFGYMWQEASNVGKGQLQFNLIHNF